jgi:diaminopropionate ammonia-lyase
VSTYRLHRNALADKRGSYPFGAIVSHVGALQAQKEIARCPQYRPTPLLPLQGVARKAHVAAVLYKDEATRFGLGSFKALGGAYAVAEVLRERLEVELGRRISISELVDGSQETLTKTITVACATDGNHGRAVAAGAQTFGCQAAIFLHEGVSAEREAAIARYGARIVRTLGNYDASVAAATHMAEAQGWIIVSDTSWPGYEKIPALIMQGYSVMIVEILAQIEASQGALPSHVFLQGGVGGLAAAVAGYMWDRLGPRTPKFIVVEPEHADCLYQSAIAGKPTPSSGDLDTIMAGLACGEVSLVAWKILEAVAEYFMTLPDAAAMEAMRLLARGVDGDPPIVAGESAVAGLAGLLALGKDVRSGMGLDQAARVLLIGTEGATDPVLYRQIVGEAR